MSIGIGMGNSPIFGGSVITAPFDPSDISDWIAAYRGDEGKTLSGADVTAWADQSGNGNHLASGAGNPLNGSNYIEFDGVDEELIITGISTSPQSYPVSMIWVMDRVKDLQDAHALAWDAGGTPGWSLASANRHIAKMAGVNQIWTSTEDVDGTPTIFSMVIDSSDIINIYENGVLQFNEDMSSDTPDVLTDIIFGSRNGSRYANIKMYDYDLYGKEITTEEHNNLGNYYATRHSLTWSTIS